MRTNLIRVTKPITARVIGLAVVTAVLLAGTAGTAAGVPATHARSAATPAGGKLVVARGVDIDKLDPHTAVTFAALQTLPLVYESLVQLDDHLAVKPGLARAWTFTDGNKTLTLKLRSGVSFEDGTPFTSADVKASLTRILNPKTGAVAASNLASIETIKTPNPATAVLKLKFPNVPILAALADMNTAIVSRKAIAAKTVAKKANGTGPYRIAKWVPGQYINVVRNDAYWGGAAKIGEIDFRAIPTETSISAAVRSGTADIGIVSNPVVAQTAGQGGVKVVREPSIDYHVLMLNGRSGPLQDARVRQALACAVDRNQVLQTAALNEGKVTGPITSPAFLSDPSDRACPTPDIAKAKQLLTDAGFGSGFTLATIVETGEYATAVPEAQNLQAQLQQIGVKLDLQVLDANTYVQRWLDESFDAAVAYNTGRADPDTQYGRYFTSTGSLNKQGGIASPAIDQLFAAGRAATAATKRRAIYKKLSQTLEQQAPWVWLYVGYNYYIVGKRVQGFTPTPNGSLQYLRTTTVR